MLVQEPAHVEECILQTPWPQVEALGMSLPYNSSDPAISENKKRM